MNIVKMSVATVLAFLLLLLFVAFGLPTYYLVNRVNSNSKAYKVYEIIISPLADCFIKILDFISD